MNTPNQGYVTVGNTNIDFGSNVGVPAAKPKLKQGHAVTAQYDRYQAAQQLRTLTHERLTLGPIKSGSRLSKTMRGQLNARLQTLRDRQAIMHEHLKLVEAPVKERRAKAAQEVLASLRMDVSLLSNEILHLQAKLDEIKEPQSAPDDWYSLVKRLYELAQCLPTVPDIPQTPADNTLRAIIALLRAHHFEGLEGVTQTVKKEVESVEAQLAEVAAAVGGPVPVGAAPGFGDESDDDDPDSYDE